MYNQPFFIPRYYNIPNIMPTSMIPATASTGRNIALFSRLGNIFQGFKSFNWSGLINNTSKTLGIINQSIPIVRQVGPIFGNMKSMIKLASVFKEETDPIPNNKSSNNNDYPEKKESLIDNNTNYNSPTFFI